MVNNKKNPVSLIPYLEPDGTGFTVKLPAGQNDDRMVQPSSSTFQVVSESNPFSKIIQAEIISDAAGLIEPAFLLTQKDIYTLPDEMMPLTNLEVEKNWQQAFLYYSRNRLSNPPLIINEQINKNGELIAFQPLWYCRHKRSYFQPLCPDCGEPFELCYDDDVLIKNGLMPFSDSIQRYLYCSHCIESTDKNSVFYVPELDPKLDKHAPAYLKSRDDLICEIGKLKGKEHLSNDLPCVACDNHQECFGEKRMAVLRIAVFSFYPFYMMIFKASCTNAIDVISMISQTPVTERENQKKGVPAPDVDLKQKPAPEISAAKPEISEAKKDINRILKNILKTWQKEVAVYPVQNQNNSAILSEKENGDRTPVSDRGPEGEGDLDRTVVISSRNDISKRMAAVAQKQDLEKTVVISKKDKIASEKNDLDNMVNRQMEKTVIITADTIEKAPSPVAGQGGKPGQTTDDSLVLKPKVFGATDKTAIIQHNHSNDDLDKTFIISPDKEESGHRPTGSDRTIIFADDLEGEDHLMKKITPEKITPDESLEKTVIIKP